MCFNIIDITYKQYPTLIKLIVFEQERNNSVLNFFLNTFFSSIGCYNLWQRKSYYDINK